MKKIAIYLIIGVFISGSVFANDVSISITIPSAKVQRVADGFLVVRPIPDDDSDGNPDYTTKAWLKKCIRDFIKGTVQEGENRLRHKTADNSVNNDDVTE